jgi:zinc transport system permease protein
VNLFDDFMVRAAVAGLGMAIVAGPLGCFVVWRRMAYYGDTLAHSALLGIALGFLLDIDIILGVVALCVVVALAVGAMQRRGMLATDTLLGIMSHSTLALGIVALAFLETVRVDLLVYLFGDILAVGVVDIAWIYGGGAVVLAVMTVMWRRLLSLTVHDEMAQVEGINVPALRLAFMVLLALVIAVAMKIVGIILITSLLIIPAATARRFSRTPEQMAVLAAVIGCLAVIAGLAASFRFDTPSGPSVVAAAFILFLVSRLPLPGRAAA